MQKLTSYLCGDFNVNLLKINTERHCNAYFDMIISHGFFPRITLPTRMSDESSTLIDNIFSIDVDMIDTSGVLVKQISDHQIIFTRHIKINYLEKNNKFVTVETKDEHSMQNFVDELKQLNICDQVALHIDVNPTDNYQIFSQLLNYAKNKHLPTKTVKYNKKKHYKSKWITGAILKSINTKDKLYKTLAKTDSQSVIYQTLKKDFQQFQKTLKSTIRMAKKMYFHRTFTLYKGDIKKTWLIINKTLSNKKTSDLSQSFRIGNKLISDPNEIANEFNKYFINIGKQISNQIVPTQFFQSYLTSPTNKRFKLMEVDDNEDNAYC